jgi:hypothetical protein
LQIIADVEEDLQPDCVSFPIPQSVESLKRTAWCRRSIQNKVPPRRQSNLLEKGMVLLLPGTDVRARNYRRSAKGFEYGYSGDLRLVSGVGEVDELDSGELEGGDGMFDFRVFRKAPDR